mmetsp:Transcript_11488/g.19092  ORF Transcript_11488/g.19092 Transcript_11488/m.19092 type:complete len:650 (+) Transcript_11488:112-2061(+)
MVNYNMYQPLWDSYSHDCKEGEPTVLMHPNEEQRPYTMEELINVRRRPFASRWYITGLNINWTTVWLRSHFTDDAENKSPTRRIRDFVKATITTENEVAAKSILSDLLTQWFEMEQSDYYSLACMMGSVLCDHGEGISFETQEVGNDNKTFMIKSKKDEELARLRFTRLMHILFSKISIERFLVKDDGSNIFRLAYCLSQILDYKNHGDNFLTVILKSYGAALTAFVSQLTLTAYIILAVGTKAHESLDSNGGEAFANPEMIPLALLTLFLSGIFILPSIRNAAEISKFYYHETRNFVHPLTVMDYISNIVLPLLLAVFGFLVVLIQSQGDFIEGVLNSTALLFILDIDDILPNLIDIDSTSVVRNHLIMAALRELEEMRDLLELDTENAEASIGDRVSLAKKRLTKKKIDPIQFSDLLLTNFICGGSDVKDSRTFAPYEVKGKRKLPNVSNSNFITSDCLLRRVEWTYTTGYPLSSKPRIGLLRLWKLGNKDEPYEVREIGERGVAYSGEGAIPIDPHSEVLIDDPHQMSTEVFSDRIAHIMIKYNDEGMLNKSEEKRHDRDDALDELNETYSIDGVYMITCFEMSDAVMRLRICGSKTATQFASAMHYYSLWDVDPGAERLLNESSSKSGPTNRAAAKYDVAGTSPA